MQAFMIRVTEQGKAQPVPLTGDRTLVGRLDDCQIRIRSGKISRHHCEILKEGGSLKLRDLGSSNGTFVNQERVEETELKAGDLVAIGSLVFLVQVNGDPEEFEPGLLYEDGLPEKPESDPEYAASHTPKPVHMHAPTAAGDDSSMMDFNFEFDLDDDDDSQPPL
ncbi:MAG: FHA domain-containing protein [Phycisphaerales bacterium]